MNKRILKLFNEAGFHQPEMERLGIEDKFEKFAELIVKECAYLVNHQQRTTGYTTHVQMLCREFGIEFREEDYFGDRK